MRSPSRCCLGEILLSLAIITLGCGPTAEGTGSEDHRQSLLSPGVPQTEARNEGDIVRFVETETTPPPPYDEGTYINVEQAWIAGFNVKVTRNKGLTWYQLNPTPESESAFGKVGYTYTKPYFISPTDGWLRSSTGTWQTRDGGNTWKRIFPSGSGIPRFADASHGWANVARNESSRQSYVTDDGGISWRPCGSERNGESWVTDVAYFVSPKLGWVITRRTIENRVLYGVARTMDLGCTWEQLWTSTEDPDETYSDIYFLNQDEGWLAGKANGSLYRTTDGGKTWEAMSLPEHMKVINVYFNDSREGWIIVKRMSRDDHEGIYHTRDAGHSWRKLAESEIDSNSRSSKQLPEGWNAGQLFRLIYSSAMKRKMASLPTSASPNAPNDSKLAESIQPRALIPPQPGKKLRRRQG